MESITKAKGKRSIKVQSGSKMITWNICSRSLKMMNCPSLTASIVPAQLWLIETHFGRSKKALIPLKVPKCLWRARVISQFLMLITFKLISKINKKLINIIIPIWFLEFLPLKERSNLKLLVKRNHRAVHEFV
jgi:hypothetical protein